MIFVDILGDRVRLAWRVRCHQWSFALAKKRIRGPRLDDDENERLVDYSTGRSSFWIRSILMVHPVLTGIRAFFRRQAHSDARVRAPGRLRVWLQFDGPWQALVRFAREKAPDATVVNWFSYERI